MRRHVCVHLYMYIYFSIHTHFCSCQRTPSRAILSFWFSFPSPALGRPTRVFELEVPPSLQPLCSSCFLQMLSSNFRYSLTDANNAKTLRCKNSSHTLFLLWLCVNILYYSNTKGSGEHTIIFWYSNSALR